VAFEAKGLGFFGDLARWIRAHLQLFWRPCVASIGSSFGGPAQVLASPIGRYTHRVAVANSVIQACDDKHVWFTWTDYRDDGALKTMGLNPDEFIGASCSMPCPTASIASVTLDSSPMAIERKGWPSVARS
jgi:hypothetical protein